LQDKKPHFNPIVLVGALIPLMLIWTFASSSLGGSADSTKYSTIISYFKNQQVTAFELNLNTGNLTMSLKEGKVALPESTQAVTNGNGGLLNWMFAQNGADSASDSASSSAQGGAAAGTAQDNTVKYSYKLPYPAFFFEFQMDDYIEAYDKANPDAPMEYNVIPYKDSIPWGEIMTLLLMVGTMGFLVYMMVRGGGAGGNIMSVGKAKVHDESENQKKATFADVAGEEEEKEELEEVVEFLKSPDKFNSLGARIPHGVLLIGPPGTGKTLLARACAGEAGVPFYAISGSDFVEMYVGVGASRVRDLFEKAKKNMPCIIFIDEIDAVGRQRGTGLGGGHDEREQTLNQLLVEMDGFEANDGVIVMAATNRSDILDKALLRPGRFDRQVYVGLPDIKGREDILKVHTRHKPLAPDVSLKVIARRTAGFAGADLENLVNEAALLAARRNKKAITMSEIEEASMKVVAGPEKKSRVVTPEEKKLTAFHEAGHAVAGYYCKHHPKVHEITIIPRGQAGGYTMYLPEKDRTYVTKSEMYEDIVSALGGRVAEQLILDDISTGASSDLQSVTDTARKMVTRYGFSERLGPVVYGTPQEETFLGRDFGQGKGYSETTAAEIDAEVRDIIDEAYETCRRTLTEHSDQLHRLAEALMEREKLTESEFDTIMEGGTLPPMEPQESEKAAAPADTQPQAEAAQADTNAAQPDQNSTEPSDAQKPDDTQAPQA
jgi:cell division protease FtsH